MKTLHPFVLFAIAVSATLPAVRAQEKAAPSTATIPAAAPAWAVATVTPELAATSHAELVKKCRNFGRYMENPPATKSRPAVALPPGWEVVKDDPRLTDFRYSVTNTKGDKRERAGRVITFSPEPERLAAWIVNAVMETSPDGKQSFDPKLATAFASFINGQSNGQFPVAGVVWEDLYNDDGLHESYRFLDGVTARNAPMEFYPPGTTPDTRATAAYTEESLAKTLTLRWDHAPVTVGTYGRIASTTADMITAYYKSRNLPPPDLKGPAFPAFVRDSHIVAMKGSRNELLVARLYHYRQVGEWNK